jgi:tetratricopeptide (TPR) repeat protein
MHGRVRDLAMALSVAVRVDPELIRAVRLALFPRFGVETEAALWFSELVRSHGPRGIVFDTAERRELHARLGRWLTQQPPGAAAHSLWEVVARVHADLSPALLLEERVTWLAVTGRRDEVDDALAPVLKAIAQENRDGLKRWFASAWERLPTVVQQSATGWQLAQVARPHFAQGRFPLDTVRAPVANRLLGDLARLLDDIRITVRRDGDFLEVDGTAIDPDARADVPPNTYTLPVPDTAPRTLTVLGGGPRGSDRELSIPVNWQVRVPVPSGTLQVRTARGEVFVVPEQAVPARRTELRGRFLGISAARHDSGLPAVPHPREDSRKVGDALAEYYTAEYLDDPTLATLRERLARLRSDPADAPEGPLVVYYRGPVVLGADGEELLLAVRDSDARDPLSHLRAEDLYAVCAASGASQVLVVLDLAWSTRTPDGLGVTFSTPFGTTGPGEWIGHIVTTHTFPGSAPYRGLGGWLVEMLRRGPSVPPVRGWEPRRRFVTGADLMSAAGSHGFSDVWARGEAGTPGALLPNPRYALRRFPDDVDPAEFGESYAAEAGAFLREVIAEPATVPEERDRAVTNMRLLGIEQAIGAGRALHELAERYARSGRRAEAVAAAESAVEVLSPLAEREQSAALPALGQALDGLTDRLTETGRWEDALTSAREAADTWRLAVEHSAANRLLCASSLRKLATVWLGVGRAEEAVAPALEGVRLYRDLQAFGGPFRSGLARTLTVLSRAHAALGRHQEALDAAVEAVDIHRARAGEADAAPSEELAEALRDLWQRRRRLGRYADALSAVVEYEALRRELAQDEAERPLRLLADALDCLAVSHGDLRQSFAAARTSREAVEIYTALTTGRSAVDHRPALALSLRNLSVWLGSVPGRLREALSTVTRAVDVYRQLEAEHPGRHEAGLAAALEGMSHCLFETGDLARAAAVSGEAVAIYRGLTARHPSVHRLALARSVNSLSICLDALGRREEARRLRAEVKSLILDPEGGGTH